jgi:hypothetical protein
MSTEVDWEKRYRDNETGWDIGSISTPLKAYFEQIKNKELRILIPGGGNGHEATFLHNIGFKNVFLLDIAPSPLREFATRNTGFPEEHLLNEDFFQHKGQYDLIVEQTFFCAITPALRKAYAEKVHELLSPKGKLIALLWSVPMNEDRPPYGGCKEEYLDYFDPLFTYHYFEEAYNSIQPRAGRELFLLAEKR